MEHYLPITNVIPDGDDLLAVIKLNGKEFRVTVPKEEQRKVAARIYSYVCVTDDNQIRWIDRPPFGHDGTMKMESNEMEFTKRQWNENVGLKTPGMDLNAQLIKGGAPIRHTVTVGDQGRAASEARLEGLLLKLAARKGGGSGSVERESPSVPDTTETNFSYTPAPMTAAEIEAVKSSGGPSPWMQAYVDGRKNNSLMRSFTYRRG